MAIEKHWACMATPRRQGAGAFRQGERRDANPYEAETTPHRSWGTGYATAATKAARQPKP